MKCWLKCGYIFQIPAQEMTEIVRAIYDMMGKYTYPALTGDVPQQHVDAFFQVCVSVVLNQVLLLETGSLSQIVFLSF